jgi:3-deoxy-7-phosphoheptulonate synthase
MPIGFKNSTAGDLVAAVNAINAAGKPQTFLGVAETGMASAVTTSGNPDCHIILRGGENGPNYSADDVARAITQLTNSGVNDAIMTDASHANCAKDHTKMPSVYREIIRQRSMGNKKVVGAMLESHLVAGNQKFPQPLADLIYGQSITDKCIDWQTTVNLITETAEAL